MSFIKLTSGVIACLSQSILHASSPLVVSAFAAKHRTPHACPPSFVTTGAAAYLSACTDRCRVKAPRGIYAVPPETAQEGQYGSVGGTDVKHSPVFFADDVGDESNGAVNAANGVKVNGASPPDAPPTLENAGEDANTEQQSPQNPISNVDARVLQSILEEGKLNLSSEAEVKRLLDGPRRQEDQPISPEEEKGAYSSKFVSTISDNNFWNSVKAKAAAVLDSVQIYVANRIETDSKLVGSVGLFALDRIRQDVSRALPAARKQVQKLAVTALLASNSSYAENILNDPLGKTLLLPSKKSANVDGPGNSIYDDLSTPVDEIKKVTESIRDILSGKEVVTGQRSISGAFDANNRGLRSIAPAGTSRVAERQRRAYQTRKQTTLRREKEGIDRKIGRTIGSVTDAAWEMKNEMQVERNKPGYRSKAVRAALAGASVRLLEAGRESGRWLTDGAKKERKPKALGSTPSDAQIMDAVVSIEEFVQVVETDVKYASEGILSSDDFTEERERFITSLDLCLSRPGEAWLTKEVVAEATEDGKHLDGEVLREVITSMVYARDELIIDARKGNAPHTIDYVKGQLRRMKEMIDSVSTLAISAAGQDAAHLLKSELEGFVLSDSLYDIIETEMSRIKQQKIETSMSELLDDIDPVFEIDNLRAGEQIAENFTGMNYAEVEVVVTRDEIGEGNTKQMTTTETSSSRQERDAESRSTVEVVTDEEYSGYEKKFKSAQSLIEDDVEDEKDDPISKFFLRTIDAVFFIAEKVFLVGLPSLLSTGAKISSRFDQAQNRGGGSKGWQKLDNIIERKRQS